MKKNIIALAIASAVAAPIAMADAPVIYGQINMAIQQTDAKVANVNVKNDGTTIDSVASRVGVKGSEDLGNGLKAIYQLEFEVGMVGKGAVATARNQFAGLAGGFGTVLAGRHDLPTKMIQATDLFDDGVADNKPMAGGLGLNGNGMETRAPQALVYVSPSFSGVKLMAALSPKEDGGNSDKESSLSDLYSVSLSYGSKNNGLYLAAGMDVASKEYTGTGTPLPAADGKKAEHVRVVAQYRTGGLVANVMYQDFSGKGLNAAGEEGTNVQANLGYQMGKFMPKVKVSSVDREKIGGVKQEDSTNYAVGLDYALGKKTTSYVTYTSIENDKGVKKTDKNVISVGLLHKF